MLRDSPLQGEELERLAELLGPSAAAALGIVPLPPDLLVSVVVPAFNERATIAQSLARLRASGMPLEILVVDDGSTDGTVEAVESLAGPDLRLLRHPSNRGKGRAVQTGFAVATGDIVAIQDADLEYDPLDLRRLLQPILADQADVVYGSRFTSPNRAVLRNWHRAANRWITRLSNLRTGLTFTDVETCYKVFRRETLERIRPNLREEGFGIELELTARLARLDGVRFHECPISYQPRTWADGKKIGWRDALRALWCLVRY